MKQFSIQLALVAALTFMGGCATKVPAYDYGAFRAAKPSTLLVMPPVNDSPDVKATAAVWSQATLPLAESGYYVLPVALVDETLKENGVYTAVQASEISYQKLREVFGADAAVYIKVLRYGTSYKIVDSETRVDVEGRIVDLRTGQQLWAGKASASSAEQYQQSQGLVGALVTAVLKQIINTAADASFAIAGTAQERLLGSSRYNGVLPGPRSPQYGQPLPTQ